MDLYIKDLLKHVRSNHELSNICDDMGDVILNLFDDEVKTLFSYKEDDDYQGSACVVYEYMNKYIWLYESFGSCSGCDGWAQGDDYSHEDTLNVLFNTISDNIVDHLYEISFPYESDYMNCDFMAEWAEFAAKHGFLEKSKCIGEKKKKQREEDYARKLLESENKKLLIEKERHKKDLEDKISYGKEVMNHLKETIEFFDTKLRSSWFDEMKSAKLRLLRFCVNELDNPENPYFTEVSEIKYDTYLELRQQAIELLKRNV